MPDCDTTPDTMSALTIQLQVDLRFYRHCVRSLRDTFASWRATAAHTQLFFNSNHIMSNDSSQRHVAKRRQTNRHYHYSGLYWLRLYTPSQCILCSPVPIISEGDFGVDEHQS